MSFRAVLVVVLLFAATVEAASGDVSFWREEVTMTCPQSGEWYIKGNTTGLCPGCQKHTVTYTGSKDLYHCVYDDNGSKYYYFYVQGKACANCYELDAKLFGGVIVVDVIGTVVIMLIVYKCTKKKTQTGPKHGANSAAHSGDRDIPLVPSPYAPLSAHTRSEDPYSVINRTG